MRVLCSKIFQKCSLKCSQISINLPLHCAFNFGSSRAQAREQPLWLIFVPDFSPSRQNLEKFYSYLFYNSLSDFGSDVWKRPCGARFERHNTLFDNQNKFCELCRPRPRQLGLMTLWWLSKKVFHFTFIRRENRITHTT